MTAYKKPLPSNRETPADPDANIDWTTADVKFGEPVTPVKVWRRELVGQATDARSALALIGEQWCSADAYDGDDHNLSFEFEIDGHRFTVTVKPL